MCTVDKKTIAQANTRLMERVRAGSIPVQNVNDNHILVPIHIFGLHPYRMSVERVNEIYGKARRKVIRVQGTHHK